MSVKRLKNLRIITKDVLNNRDDVLRLMRWRIANQQWYVEQPEITEESFRKWLTKHVFGKARFMFWVLDKRKRKIGHMGLYRFKNNSCEIDNVVRGERGDKGRMGKALNELIAWAFENTPIQNLYLRVLSHNTHAIEFYERNGFIRNRIVMVKRGSSLRFLKMEYKNSL